MTTFRAAQVPSPGAPLAVIDRALAEPGSGSVRVAVQACGICHSDSLFVDGQWPGVQFPVTPGHEIAGRIDALGDGVQGWQLGDRVAIGWTGGYCGHCRSCRRWRRCALRGRDGHRSNVSRRIRRGTRLTWCASPTVKHPAGGAITPICLSTRPATRRRPPGCVAPRHQPGGALASMPTCQTWRWPPSLAGILSGW